jgi:transposase-like protein
VQVVCESYVRGVSTRRIEGLEQDARDRADLKESGLADGQGVRSPGGAFRSRPLDGALYTYVWLDALTPEGPRGRPDRRRRLRVVATGVNAAGKPGDLGP